MQSVTIDQVPPFPAKCGSTQDSMKIEDDITTLSSSSQSTALPLSSGSGLMTSADKIKQLEIYASLGKGPVGFGPVSRSLTIQQSLKACDNTAAMEFVLLRVKCESAKLSKKFTNEQIFQVAAYKDFSVNKALKLLKNMDPRFINTTIRQIQDQLRTHTLFPLQQIRSKHADSFFYMRPSRFFPEDMPTPTIIANLIYVMDSLYERYRDYTNHKIGFIANMNDWTMNNFCVDYCFAFMMALQGRSAPVNVDLFLIVNPPAWFGIVWKIMKPMLHPAFRRRVKMIPEKDLDRYLEPGFSKYLPNEFECGQADVSSLVEDFISFRKCVEESDVHRRGAALGKSNAVWSLTKSPDSKKQSKSVRRGLFRRQSASSVGHEDAVPKSPLRIKSSDQVIEDINWSSMDVPWDLEPDSTSDTDQVSIRLLE